MKIKDTSKGNVLGPWILHQNCGKRKARKNMAFTDSYFENEGPSLQEMIDSDLKTDIVITGNTLNFQGISRPDMITDSELDSYPSFKNSYFQDFNSSANPNDVIPLHHPLKVS